MFTASLVSASLSMTSSIPHKAATTSLRLKSCLSWLQPGKRIERVASEASKARHLKQMDKRLSLAQDFFRNNDIALWGEEDEFIGPKRRHTNLPFLDDENRILLSILTLGEALLCVRHNSYNAARKRDPLLDGPEFFGVWHYPRVIDHLLLIQGWCPYEVETWRLRGTNTVRLYLSGFNRSAEAENHSSCTTMGCVWDAVDTDQYQNRHITTNCALSLSKVNLLKHG